MENQNEHKQDNLIIYMLMVVISYNLLVYFILFLFLSINEYFYQNAPSLCTIPSLT